MSSESVSISEPDKSLVSRHVYRLTLRDASGQPLVGKEVVVALQGDGSLAPGFSSKEVRREMDEAGAALVMWYRRGISGRDVKAVLSVTDAPPDSSVAFERLSDEKAAELDGPRISHIRSRLY
ncbi:MAG TPA: hypothetical protein VII57_00985 [Dehalococcoidia bacterium]